MTSDSLPFTPAVMPDGEEWLLRPVERGMCRYESLLDGTLSLVDLARMNDYLDVLAENERRYQSAMENK